MLFNDKEIRDLMTLFSKVFYKFTVGNDDLRADCVQDAIEKVLIECSKGSYDASKGDKMAWANTVGTRHVINRLKPSGTKGREMSTTLYTEDGSSDGTESIWASAVPGWRPETPEQSVLNKERREVLSTLRAKLSAEQRDALSLVYDEGLTHEEAAIAAGVPLGTMLTRVRRARQVLARNPKVREYMAA